MVKKTATVKIKLLGSVRNYSAGDVVEVEPAEAAHLVGLGYAIYEPVAPAKE